MARIGVTTDTKVFREGDGFFKGLWQTFAAWTKMAAATLPPMQMEGSMQKQHYEQQKSFVSDEIFLCPRWLPQDYLTHCALLSARSDIIRRLPRQAVVAEIGTDYGNFAKKILKIAEPREFHIFDLSFSRFDRAFFDSEIYRKG